MSHRHVRSLASGRLVGGVPESRGPWSIWEDVDKYRYCWAKRRNGVLADLGDSESVDRVAIDVQKILTGLCLYK